jgi:transcription initiation factor TFIIIB Brf1 subunit/transcription initiation factor TFIIB
MMIGSSDLVNKTMMARVCTNRGGTVIEYNTATGNDFCVKCGTVVEEKKLLLAWR